MQIAMEEEALRKKKRKAKSKAQKDKYAAKIRALQKEYDALEKKLAESREIVRQYDEQHSRSSLRDSDYMDAVNSGDMETAQRMVDEAAKAAGYHEEVFHGMGHKHNIYKSGYGQYGDGVYFTYDEDIGSGYGGVVDHLYVKIGKIADYDDAYRALGKRDDQSLDEFAQALGFQSFDDMVNDWEHDPTNVEYNYDLIELLMNEEFEGFVDEGNGGFVLWDFNGIEYRIKLADPVTYDDNGNVIPLSQRFNEENPDIRYAYAIDGSYVHMDVN